MTNAAWRACAVFIIDDGNTEEIVMTPLKPKEGRQIIRIERTTTEKLNSDRVHYVAGGTYMGIVVNRAINGQYDHPFVDRSRSRLHVAKRSHCNSLVVGWLELTP